MDAQALESEAKSAIAASSTLEELNRARVLYLGRKSELKQALRDVRDPETGRVLNTVREELERAFAAREEELERAELDRRLTDEVIDVTLPSQATERGHLHLLTQVRREVENIFLGLGYGVVDGREVETSHYNFDALNMPSWHPVRSPLHSLFLNGDVLLRTETSPSQIHVMEAQPPPVYIISPGRVYRRETVDARRSSIFHQIEGLAVDRGITLSDLKGTLLHVMRALFGEDREMRFRTHFFPFTEPSLEPDVSCFVCEGVGCRLCKYSGWIEIAGSGMVDPTLFEFVGLDPEEWTGFAFGFGIDRLAKVRYEVDDLREFISSDVRFLEQF